MVIDILLGPEPPGHNSLIFNDILENYDSRMDFLAIIRNRSGIDKIPRNSRGRISVDSSMSFLEKSGSSMLRRSSDVSSMKNVINILNVRDVDFNCYHYRFMHKTMKSTKENLQ